MVYLFLNWTLGTAGLAVLAIVLPGCRIDELRSGLVVAALVALVHAAVSTAFRPGAGEPVVALPGVLLALGDALVFRVVALLVPGFAMRSLYPALAGGLLLLVLNLALPRLFRNRDAAAQPAALNS